MNVVRCSKGHFYDADTFPICPHCQDADADNKTVHIPDIPEENETAYMSDFDDDNTTVYMANVHDDKANLYMPDINIDNVSAYKTNINDDDATVYMPNIDNDNAAVYMPTAGIHPVVGWLVCIRGKAFGLSFPLKSGRNFIGRGTDMDVILSEDKAISQGRDACIIYEPHVNVFYAAPVSPHELFYLNNHVVLDNEVLKPHDVLLLGETELLFIPLCGPDFCWENVMAKK